MSKKEVKIMNDKLKYGLAGLLIGVAATWLFTASFQGAKTAGMMGSKVESQSSDALDAHFIEQMIPHHEDAITMAKLAETKAQTPEVKQLSKDIIESQSKEIAQMRTWYIKWFGKELPAGTQVMQHHGMGAGTSMHMGMTGTQDDITRLENAEDFDKAFVEHMIPHHQMAVMMANMLKDGTDRPEMKKLAEDVITAQTKEIEEMRQWLGEWK